MKVKDIIMLLVFMIPTLLLKSQSLDSLLQMAYENNPALKAIQLEYESELQKAPQVGQLPDPTIGVGIPILRPETRLGAQVINISASQMFPWFGTLEGKKDVVLSMAKSKYQRLTAERLDIDYKIKTAYYNLIFLHDKQKILDNNVRIFETLEKVALAKVEEGKSIATDVLTVQVKVEELKNQIQMIEEQKHGFIANINEAINNSSPSPIAVDTTKLPFALLQYDLAAYRQKIEENHPIIKQLDLNIEASNKALLVNELASKPSFGVGLDYSMVSGRSDAFPDNNGRDILIPKLLVAIPLYRGKYAAKEKEEMLKQKAYEYKKESLTNNMISSIQNLKSEYERAKLMYELALKQKEISNSAYDILLADYSSKGKRFDELMALLNNIYQYEINTIKAIIQSHLVKCNIDRLTDY